MVLCALGVGLYFSLQHLDRLQADRLRHDRDLAQAEFDRQLAQTEARRMESYVQALDQMPPDKRALTARTYLALAQGEDARAAWQAALEVAQAQVEAEQKVIRDKAALKVRKDEILALMADPVTSLLKRRKLQEELNETRLQTRILQERLLRLNPNASVYDIALSRATIDPPVSEDATNPDIERVRPLLDLIGGKESGGNYNAYFGNAQNEDAPALTSLTLREVTEFQQQLRVRGVASSAVGKYQIIRKTLIEMMEKWGHPPDQVFTENFQDLLALQMMEQRGLSRWFAGERSTTSFAHALARQWAVLPVLATIKGNTKEVTRGQSYYSGDGLNKAKISAREFEAALAEVSPSD